MCNPKYHKSIHSGFDFDSLDIGIQSYRHTYVNKRKLAMKELISLWNRLVGSTYDVVNTNSNIPNEKTREYLEELARTQQKTDRKKLKSKLQKIFVLLK